MSGDVLICPSCRARVFGHWSACKFCGAALRVDRIDATIDPDDLASTSRIGPSPNQPGGDALQVGPGVADSPAYPAWGDGQSSWPGSGESAGGALPAAAGAAPPEPWGTPSGGFDDAPAPSDVGGGDGASGAPWWASEAAGSAPDPTATGATGWNSSSVPVVGGGDAEWATFSGSEASAGSLVPLGAAEPTWAPGPAPSAPTSGGDAPTGPDAPTEPTAPIEPTALGWDTIDDRGPAGLEPASWYPEPATPDTIDDRGPAGLEPASWYPEPSGMSATDRGAAPADDAGPGSSWDLGDRSAGWVAPDVGFATDDPAPGLAFTGIASPDPGGSQSFPPPPSDAPDHGHETIDTEAIFRDPEPNQTSVGAEFRNDLERVPTTGDLAVNWEPAAADAWDAPVDPEGKPKRQAVLSRESRLLLAGIIVTLLALVAVTTIRDRQNSHPSEWATNVQQMADWVAKTRKSPFEHPVAVVTLSDGDFDAAVAGASRPDKKNIRQELSDQVAMWRALGAVQGTPKAELTMIAAQRPELGAFYDVEAKRLVVRNGADRDRLREGLAGALSIALDDQRASLKSLSSTGIDENPRFDVVLGTAALMRSDFVRQNEPDAVPEDPKDAPTDAATAFLDVRPELQTRLGAPFVQLVRDVDSLDAANGLAASPPVSSQQVLLPMAYFDGRGPLVGAQPQVPDGADEIGDGTLGAQTWYLLLAAHLEDSDSVGDALDFADRWAGDAYVAYRKANGQVCVADVLRGSDESQTALLLAALQNWRKAVSGGHVDVAASGTDSVTVTACDPGAAADQDLQENLDTAIAAAATRSELAAGYYLEGTKIPNGVNGPIFTPKVAWCMGAEAVALAQSEQLAALASRTGSTYRDLTLAAGARCNTNMADQLFVDHDN